MWCQVNINISVSVTLTVRPTPKYAGELLWPGGAVCHRSELPHWEGCSGCGQLSLGRSQDTQWCPGEVCADWLLSLFHRPCAYVCLHVQVPKSTVRGSHAIVLETRVTLRPKYILMVPLNCVRELLIHQPERCVSFSRT